MPLREPRLREPRRRYPHGGGVHFDVYKGSGLPIRKVYHAALWWGVRVTRTLLAAAGRRRSRRRHWRRRRSGGLLAGAAAAAAWARAAIAVLLLLGKHKRRLAVEHTAAVERRVRRRGGRPGLHLSRHLPGVLPQQLRCLGVLLIGKREGRDAAGSMHRGVGLGVEQRLHDRRTASGSSGHQGGEAVGALQVDARAPLQEHPHHRFLPSKGSRHQQRRAATPCAARVHAAALVQPRGSPSPTAAGLGALANEAAAPAELLPPAELPPPTELPPAAELPPAELPPAGPLPPALASAAAVSRLACCRSTCAAAECF
eukprot:scaffold65150_cov67-Phaeocystis_antarctica.AAC.7